MKLLNERPFQSLCLFQGSAVCTMLLLSGKSPLLINSCLMAQSWTEAVGSLSLCRACCHSGEGTDEGQDASGAQGPQVAGETTTPRVALLWSSKTSHLLIHIYKIPLNLKHIFDFVLSCTSTSVHTWPQHWFLQSLERSQLHHVRAVQLPGGCEPDTSPANRGTNYLEHSTNTSRVFKQSKHIKHPPAIWLKHSAVVLLFRNS